MPEVKNKEEKKMSLKKVSAFLLAAVMGLGSITGAAAEEENQNVLINKSFSSEEAVTELVNDSTWTKEGENRIVYEKDDNGGFLRIGHSWFTGKISTSVNGIGEKYDYAIGVKLTKSTEDGKGFIKPEDLVSGEYFTAKTTISNGAYKLEFSVENDGLYVVNSSNKWVKLYGASGWADDINHEFSIKTDENIASVSRDGKRLFSYELPKNGAAGSYSFESNGGKNGTRGVSAFIKSISLKSYPDTKTELLSIAASEAGLSELKSDSSYTIVNKDAISWVTWAAYYEFNCAKTGGSAISIKKAVDNIGSKYLYTVTERRGDYRNDKSVADGTLSGRNIVSGDYLLDFTVETDGTYAKTAASPDSYKKVSDTGLSSDSLGTFSAAVDGNKAVLSKGDVVIAEFELPVCVDGNGYFMYETVNSLMLLRNVSLYSYSSDSIKSNLLSIAPTSAEELSSLKSDWDMVSEGAIGFNQYSACRIQLNPSKTTVDSIGDAYNGTGRVSFKRNIKEALENTYLYTAVYKVTSQSDKLSFETGRISGRNVVSGAYILDFTTEKDGVYAKTAASNGEYVKVSNTGATGGIDTFSAFVSGKNASVYKDGVWLCSYEMPAGTGDVYSMFEIRGCETNVKSINIYNYNLPEKTKTTASASISDGKLVINSGDFDETVNSQNAYCLIAAVYNKDGGALTDIDFAEISSEDAEKTITVQFDPSLQDAVIFVWDTIGSLKPCGVAQSVYDFAVIK